MFSEKLENLIKASLQDGLLTEQEKRAILKRAEAEGEDPNEVDIYIQSLLQKSLQNRRKIEDEKDEQRAQIKKKEMGRVCPNCGRQVPPLTLKCECGFEFTSSSNKKSSVQELAEKISVIRDAPMSEALDDAEKEKEKEERRQKILELIKWFPVPNTKEDVIEFLSLSAPNSRKKGGILGTVGGRLVALMFIVLIIIIIGVVSGDEGRAMIFGLGSVGLLWCVIGVFEVDKDTLKWNKDATVWRAKFDQVLMKGRSLRGDPEFQRQLDYYEGVVNKK
ncbi:MAG: hypothetical protein IJG35_03355 [Bacteroidales bacterium]|nr:hypothetical protein [Bacteroidales bacterium]